MVKISDPTIFRTNIKMYFSEILDSDKYGDNLERGIYNSVLKIANEKNIVKKWVNMYFIQLYIDKFKTIYINLQNPIILNAILEQKIKSQDLPFMTHQEMLPEKWSALIEDLKIKNMNKYMPKIEASTDDFTCYKCHAVEVKKANEENRPVKREEFTQCTHYQLQTRSADEPMTTFVTCIKCGCRWKC